MSLDVKLIAPVYKGKILDYDDPLRWMSNCVQTLYRGNIANNLGEMASESGIYMALWRPEEIGIRSASKLIEPLKRGLIILKLDRIGFAGPRDAVSRRRLHVNGWGIYDDLVRFVYEYLEACEKWPNSAVRVSR